MNLLFLKIYWQHHYESTPQYRSAMEPTCGASLHRKTFYFGRVFLGCIVNMNKNYLFHLTGCAVFLLVGARTQNAKAVYPAASVVEAHWRQNPRIFQETFDALFPKAGQLFLWSEKFPKWLKERNGNPCEIKMGSDRLSFHTLDDLAKLPCDADLKEIIRVLGSTEFLTRVLPEGVIDSVFAHAIGCEELRLKIVFSLYCSNGFFNVLGKGSLYMGIVLWDDDKKAENKLKCSFVFDFGKEKSVTVLKNCTVSYRAGNNKIEMDFLKKTDKLPHFPWNAVMKAKEKFSSVYAKLRDDLKKGRKKYECCKICQYADGGKRGLEKRLREYRRPSYVREMEKRDRESNVKYIGNPERIWFNPEVLENVQLPGLYDKYNMQSVLNVLITEDFLKGVFGEEFWNILEHSISECARSGLHVSFEIHKYAYGLKVLFIFCRSYHGKMAQDAVSFERTSGYNITHRNINWEWLDSNYIEFVFFYDPQKDEISHVRLQNKLILNDELIQEGETEDVLLIAGNEDYGEPSLFEEVLKKSGIHP